MYNKKLFFIIFSLCFLIGILVCFVWSFFIPNPEELLSYFSFSYWCSTFFLLVFQYFFAIHCSSLIISYSYSFSKIPTSPNVKQSSFFLNELKSATILSIIFLVLFFSVQEIGIPFLKSSQVRNLELSKEYIQSVELAKKLISEKDYKNSLFYLNFAIQLDPKNKELLSLRDVSYAKCENSTKNSSFESAKEKNFSLVGEDKNLTAQNALLKAQDAFSKENWYDAHYYGTISSFLSDERNPDKDKALRITADAWNILNQQVFTEKQRKENSLFSEKMKGYELIQQGAFLDAYYHFYNLTQQFSNDPDIQRYFNIAKQGVEESFFFTDEVTSFSFFDSKSNIFLKIPEQNNNFFILFAKKITNTNLKNSTNSYLKDLSLIHVLTDETSPQKTKIEYTISTPYAKIVPITTKTEEGDFIWQPLLLLHSVDRQEPKKDFKPTITGSLPFTKDSIVIMDISIDELSLLTKISTDVKTLSTFNLVSISNIAEKAGISSQIIFTELSYRLSTPIVFLIFSLLCLIWGWKYKVNPGKQFHFFWIFFIPIIFCCFYIIFDLITTFIYYLSTFLVSFCGLYFGFCLPVLLIIIYCITVGMTLTQKRDA